MKEEGECTYSDKNDKSGRDNIKANWKLEMASQKEPFYIKWSEGSALPCDVEYVLRRALYKEYEQFYETPNEKSSISHLNWRDTIVIFKTKRNRVSNSARLKKNIV